MTDAELEALEQTAKAAQDETENAWDVSGEGKAISAFIAAANPATIIDLITELRQTKAERDWLADYIAILTGQKSYNRKEHWIKAAKEAVCQK